MDAVQGRTTDFLCRPDGTIQHALSIIYPLRELHGVRQFRVTQQADWSVHVELVPDRFPASITGETVLRAVRPVLGETVSVHVEFVEAIAPSASGKHRYVQSFVAGEKGMDATETVDHENALAEVKEGQSHVSRP